MGKDADFINNEFISIEKLRMHSRHSYGTDIATPRNKSFHYEGELPKNAALMPGLSTIRRIKNTSVLGKFMYNKTVDPTHTQLEGGNQLHSDAESYKDFEASMELSFNERSVSSEIVNA